MKTLIAGQGSHPVVDDHVLLEEYAFLREQQVSDADIARQLGYSRIDSLYQALRRAGYRRPERAA